MKKWHRDLDWWIPRLMVLAVLAVATFAFVQSYTHVFYLGETHHQSGASLRMLPLSVDWLMFAAGLTRLHLLRKEVRHWMPVAGLALGAIATLIANIAAGIIWGWQTAAVNAWAPLVLFVTVELAMLLVRTAKAKAKPEEAKPDLRIIPFEGELTQEQAAEIKRELEARGFNGNGYQPETRLRQPQGTRDPSPETATMPKAVDSPQPALEGWGQLAGQEPAGQPEMLERRPGLTGIGLRNRQG